jgi:hypothetical protein
MKNIIHSDGRVTYWAVYRQVWVRRVHPADIPDHELAAMSAEERDQIIAMVSAPGRFANVD